MARKHPITWTVRREYPLAFVVYPSGKGFARVIPIYQKDGSVITGSGKNTVRICVSGYEHGEPLNGTYEDPDGVALASIASQAISALESRKRCHDLAKKRKRK